MEDDLEVMAELVGAGVIAAGAAVVTLDVLGWRDRIKEERAKKEAEEAKCPCP